MCFRSGFRRMRSPVAGRATGREEEMDGVSGAADRRMAEVVSLCKRRGFIFQGSEIYGGLNGFWDYGPLGVELRRNVKDSWWRAMVDLHENIVGMDSAVIMHPDVWRASGHVDCFHDPMVDCKECKSRFRADQIEGDRCPECGGELTEPRQFNLMFKTFVGATEDSSSVAYLRPETAQAIFVNFKQVQQVSRLKLPFGIAQIGKAFRNEVTPRNFIFRSREFEQMEMEFFVRPEESERWFEHWVRARYEWFLSIGLRESRLRLRAHGEEELAHYARACKDVEYEFPFGWQELEGIADRGTFDLQQHIDHSGKDLSYFDEESKSRIVPAVVETSVGVDRTLLALLCDAYEEETCPNGEKRVVLRFAPAMAPVQVGVFPLVKKLSSTARRVERMLRGSFRTFYDEKGAIGRRYRRQDEIGTPFCVTNDYDTEEDGKVTVRDRDSMQQERVSIDRLEEYLRDRFASWTPDRA